MPIVHLCAQQLSPINNLPFDVINVLTVALIEPGPAFPGLTSHNNNLFLATALRTKRLPKAIYQSRKHH